MFTQKEYRMAIEWSAIIIQRMGRVVKLWQEIVSWRQEQLGTTMYVKYREEILSQEESLEE